MNKTQWSDEVHVFKCWCGEDSYLEITADKEDREIYITITKHPTRLGERLTSAWKALRGLEFSASNHVMIDEQDIRLLVEALNSYDQTK